MFLATLALAGAVSAPARGVGGDTCTILSVIAEIDQLPPEEAVAVLAVYHSALADPYLRYVERMKEDDPGIVTRESWGIPRAEAAVLLGKPEALAILRRKAIELRRRKADASVVGFFDGVHRGVLTRIYQVRQFGKGSLPTVADVEAISDTALRVFSGP